MYIYKYIEKTAVTAKVKNFHAEGFDLRVASDGLDYGRTDFKTNAEPQLGRGCVIKSYSS